METEAPPTHLPLRLIACHDLDSGPEDQPRPQLMEFASPQLLRQIRIPRTSCFVHFQLKKYENQFVKNNFWLEIFGLDAGTQKYTLLFADQINTEKATREFLIPITGDALYSALLFKGDFQSTLVVVYAQPLEAGTSSPPQEPALDHLPASDLDNGLPDPTDAPSVPVRDFPLEEKEALDQETPEENASAALTRPPENNYLLLNEIPGDDHSGKEGALSLPGSLRALAVATPEDLAQTEARMAPRPLFVPKTDNISPSLLLETSSDADDDKNVPQSVLLSELDDFAKFLQGTLHGPRGQLTQKDLMVYFRSMATAISKIRLFIRQNQSEGDSPFFFQTQVAQNAKINQDYCQLAKFSIEGKIANENEKILGQMLVACLANSPEHVQAMADLDFVLTFLDTGFQEPGGGVKLSSLFFDNFCRLLMHKSFREVLFDPKNEEIFRKRFDAELSIGGPRGREDRREREGDGRRGGRESRDHRDDRRDDPRDDRRDQKASADASDHPDGQRGRFTDPRGHSDSRGNGQDPQSAKRIKDHSDPQTDSRQLTASHRPPRSEPAVQPAWKPESESQAILMANFRSMLLSSNNLGLRKFLKQHKLLSFVMCTVEFTKATKRVCFFPTESTNLLRVFEDAHFHLQQHFRILRELVVQGPSSLVDPPKVHDELKQSVKQIYSAQTPVFSLISNASAEREKIISCALATLIFDEHFLEHLVLYLSHPPLMTSDFFEATLTLALRLLLFICTCRGGIPLLLKAPGFIESLTKFLEELSKSDSEATEILSEALFGKLSLKRTTFHSRFVFRGAPIAEAAFRKKVASPAFRVAALAAQHGLFFRHLNSAVTVMDEVYQKLLDWDNHHLLLIHLTQIDWLLTHSVLSRQAMTLVLRERNFFDALLVTLDISDLQTFERQRFEVAIVCKILFEFLQDAGLPVIIRVMNPLRDALKKVTGTFEEYRKSPQSQMSEPETAHLTVVFHNLTSILTPFEKLRDDFGAFLTGFQTSSRYTHTNINTLLANRQHYSLVEREFPKADPKRYFARLTDYIGFFRTPQHLDNKVCLAVSYLKAVDYALKVNKALFQDFVKENIFDMVNFVALVGANVVTAFLGGSQLSRDVQRVYNHQKNALLDSYFDLTAITLKVLIRKTAFKEKHETEGKEYENTDLFLAVLDLLAATKAQNPAAFYELLVVRVFEAKDALDRTEGETKQPLGQFKALTRLAGLEWSADRPKSAVYLSAKTRQKMVGLYPKLFRFLALFSRFPGSFDTLLCELLFEIFTKPTEVEVYLSALAVFITEPRRWKDREKFRRMIHTVLIEKVRTAKRSPVILTQKYGCTRPDSVFDIHVSDNGYQRTLEYLISRFLGTSEDSVFLPFGLFLVALVEWKDPVFCSEIAFNIRAIVRTNAARLQSALGIGDEQIENRQELMEDLRRLIIDGRKMNGPVELDRVLFLVKTIGRALQTMNFVSLSGVLKLYLMEEGLVLDLIMLLQLGHVYGALVSPEVRPAFLLLKVELWKSLAIFFNSEVGFSMRRGDGLSDDRQQTDIPKDGNCYDLLELLNKELEMPARLQEDILGVQADDKTTPEAQAGVRVIMEALEALQVASKNQKVRMMCCYGDYVKPPNSEKRPLLDLRDLTSFFLRFCEESASDRDRRDDRDPRRRDNVPEPQGPPPVLTRHSAVRVLKLYDAYLRVVLNLIPVLPNRSFVYTELGLKSLCSIMFRRIGFKGQSDRLFRLHSRLKSHLNKTDPLYVRTKFMVGALDTYAANFDKERKKLDRFDDVVPILEAKTRLNQYNKNMAKFEDSLNRLGKKRFMTSNFFPEVRAILEAKMVKDVRPFNTAREVLLHQTRLFRQVQCELTRALRAGGVDPAPRHDDHLRRLPATDRRRPGELRGNPQSARRRPGRSPNQTSPSSSRC